MKTLKTLLYIATVCTLLFSCNKDNDPVDPNEPKACFDEVPSVAAGTEIQFTSTCSENATEYLWDFGDEATSTEANPKHTFASEGTYTVTLTVYKDTKSASTQRTVTITAPVSTCTVSHFNRDLNTSETWKTGETHCISGFFQIRDGAVLTIEPGVTVKLQQHAGIYVVGIGAAIVAEGTEASPILFTSAKAVPQPGDWVSVGFNSDESASSSLKYCIFEYGGSQVYSSFDATVGMVDISYDKKVSIDHCTFRKSLTHAVKMDSYSELAAFTNNSISEAGDYAIFARTQNVHSIGTGNTINNKGIWIEGEWLNGDVTWLKHTCPYYAQSLSVGSTDGVTLTIAPGVEIRFLGGAATRMHVGDWGDKGMLIAQGTPTEKIVFTSGAETPAPGDWGGFTFDTGTMGGSILDNVVIEYASGNDTDYAAVSVTTNSLVIQNTAIRNVKGIGISLDIESSRRFAGFTNNVISSPATAYALKMSTAGIPSIGEGNEVDGKSIYVFSNSIPTVQHIIWQYFDIPYIVDGRIQLGSDTYPDHSFTIEAGTVMKFTPNSGFWIAASNPVKFVAEGTVDKPILFTSASETAAPGDWDGIEFYNRLAAGSIMNYCTIEYGGSRYANVTSYSVPDGILTISNCEMNSSSKHGFYSFQSSPTMTNNTYSGNVMGDTNIQ